MPSRATTCVHLMKHWSTGYSERLIVKVQIHSVVVVVYTVYLSQRRLSNRHSGPSAPQAQNLGRRETTGDCWTVIHAHHFLRSYLPHLWPLRHMRRPSRSIHQRRRKGLLPVKIPEKKVAPVVHWFSQLMPV
jgi:hypothetical protein